MSNSLLLTPPNCRRRPDGTLQNVIVCSDCGIKWPDCCDWHMTNKQVALSHAKVERSTVYVRYQIASQQI